MYIFILKLRPLFTVYTHAHTTHTQVYYERASQDRQRYLEELKAYISEIHKGDLFLVTSWHTASASVVVVFREEEREEGGTEERMEG